MRRLPVAVVLPALIALAAVGCQSIAPPPPPTVPPTETAVPEPTATITPTPGPREFINAAYCWPSPIDAGSFSLLRFFDDGIVLDAGVAPFSDCQAAWQAMGGYMTRDAVDTFNHGEYFLSAGNIRFVMSQARTNKVIGEMTGRIEGSKMILTRGGAEELEYVLVLPGP